jgi:hypothetical protein
MKSTLKKNDTLIQPCSSGGSVQWLQGRQVFFAGAKVRNPRSKQCANAAHVAFSQTKAERRQNGSLKLEEIILAFTDSCRLRFARAELLRDERKGMSGA